MHQSELSNKEFYYLCQQLHVTYDMSCDVDVH